MMSIDRARLARWPSYACFTLCAALAGCPGVDPDPEPTPEPTATPAPTPTPDPDVTYTVGGTVTGLEGELRLSLANVGLDGDPVTVTADGAFTLPRELADGTDFDVRVLVPPEHQECTIANGGGTIDGADVTDVEVTCTEHAVQWLMVQSASTLVIDTDPAVACPDGSTFAGLMALQNVDSDTLWFSDRPDRLMAHTATSDFVNAWPTIFAEEQGGAPTATVLWDDSEAETAIVVELLNPLYDAASELLIYEICGLATESPTHVAGIEMTPADLDIGAHVPIEHVGEAVVFIDATTHSTGPTWVQVQNSTDVQFDFAAVQDCKADSPFSGSMTLTGVDERTLWFTDRPFHKAAYSTTSEFVGVWGDLFSAETGGAPNAVVAWDEDGTERLVTVELFDPQYSYDSDSDTHTVTYGICGVPADGPTEYLGMPLSTHPKTAPDAAPLHDGRISVFIDAANAAHCALSIPVAVPAFSCSDGEIVPKAWNNSPTDTTCDRPELLYNRCVFNSRLGRLAENNGQDVDIVFSCRKSLGSSHEGDTSNDFYDIAIIQHNRATGATCFYQRLNAGDQDGENLPAPETEEGRAYWNQPVNYCSQCHANGPFIRSPNYWNVTDSTGAHVLPSIGSINKYFLANETAYEVFNVSKEGNACTSCHNIGAYRSSPTSPLQLGRVNYVAAGTWPSLQGIGHPSPTTSGNDAFMVPYVSPAPGMDQQQTANAAIAELEGCLETPTPADCALVPQARAAVCPPITGEQCYWMENTSGNYCWVQTPITANDSAACQALDSCSPGGGGGSGGGCYKWADCSDCPPQAWP